MANDDLQDWRNNGPGLEDAVYTQQVRTALRRLDAPEGFTDRVMAGAEQQSQTRWSARSDAGGRRGVLLRLNRPVWRAAYAAAAVLALTAGTLRVEHRRTEQRRADMAAAQLDTALEVTNHALDQVSAKLETTEFGEVQRALETNEGGR